MATLLCTPSGQHTGPEATPGFWRGTVSLEAEAACAWHCPWPPASVAFLPKGSVEAPTLAYGGGLAPTPWAAGGPPCPRVREGVGLR